MEPTFGRKLYTLMVNNALTQSELARRSGLPKHAIHALTMDQRAPLASEKRAIAKVFDIEETDL